MPFWIRRKGKEKAKDQDDADAADNIWRPPPPSPDHFRGQLEDDKAFVGSDGRMVLVPDYRTIEAPPGVSTKRDHKNHSLDENKNDSWNKLHQYWEQEAERRRNRIAKIEEAKGKCSLVAMAAWEDAVEALNMYMETDWTPGKPRLTCLKLNDEQTILQAYEEKAYYCVPELVARSALDSVINKSLISNCNNQGVHEECCCANVKKDPMYLYNLRTGSFRGPTPIKRDVDIDITTLGAVSSSSKAGLYNNNNNDSDSDLEMEEEGAEKDKESERIKSEKLKTDKEDGDDVPTYDTNHVDQGDALPSYKEALSHESAS